MNLGATLENEPLRGWKVVTDRDPLFSDQTLQAISCLKSRGVNSPLKINSRGNSLSKDSTSRALSRLEFGNF